MKHIRKVKLQNFKRFSSFSVEFDKELNLLIGDNEAGKSSILTAMDLVMSGSRSKIETAGIESLFNVDAIQYFFDTGKKYENLPRLFIELYLSEQDDPDLNGKNNSDNVICDGLTLICEPNDSLGKEILDILKQDEANFPFEYYSIRFETFSGLSYTGYRKFLRHIFIDNSQINNEYAAREYVRAIYGSNTKDTERHRHHNEYRKVKETFKATVLNELNSRVNDYAFGVKSNHKANLETDLMLTEHNINIENKGKGRQCFIKTEFALKKTSQNIDVILLEEPENHLSHINMKKLIHRIRESKDKQLFITTHSNMISTRLDLRKSILLNSNSKNKIILKSLSEGTAKFFMKAPDNNIIEFILAKKVILVEGDAEFMLMDAFFRTVTGVDPEVLDVHIISVGGTSFKRYLELAKMLGIKTAVIRDNDGDLQSNCLDRYKEFIAEHINIFSDKDNSRNTFEVSVYQDNVEICDALFGKGRSLSPLEYMLKNKADAAFKILDEQGSIVVPPDYIQAAIKWIGS